MQDSARWRLSVSLRDGPYAQIATLDFSQRETIDAQLAQLSFEQYGSNCRQLFEFTNESGELLAFRASAYRSYSVAPIGATTALLEPAALGTQGRSA
jgi:hypothetical protein